MAMRPVKDIRPPSKLDQFWRVAPALDGNTAEKARNPEHGYEQCPNAESETGHGYRSSSRGDSTNRLHTVPSGMCNFSIRLIRSVPAGWLA
jgi:hypothetical protein